ncbi:RHS repeat domain-containing protein [Pseudomonas sp. HMWF021]|uniref:RHS repeat domain-containing protein n=1 Tax=Pseudomonas sp. HMWF021 TaxID=2056857 RepID=UPI000D3D63B2|nr:RHS repeat-associated core domain-containing protein [Pseudomonas sp. HMWF021]PTT31254.1 type IV secretion protein Rhs [Pseudomonas sp. HMWF021]
MGMHSKTPTLQAIDPRGLMIRTIDYWRADESLSAEARVNGTVRDPAGRAVKQWDPRLWALQAIDPLAPPSLSTVYSLSQNVLRSESCDAGLQIELHGLGGEVVFGWDGRGTRREAEYDELLRAVAVYETGTGLRRRCVERLTYGRAAEGGQARNQAGQLIRHDDPAGSVFFDQFAITGQCIENTRHFTRDPVSPDWPLPVQDRQHLLEPGEGAISQWRFSALGQMLEQVDARGNRQRFEMTFDGHLREAHLQLKQQTVARPLVFDIRYNADGQIEHELAANGVRTTLVYRPEDGRLMTRSAVSANEEKLQQLGYTYDPMGNVLSIEDQALPIRYFANQRIEPVSHFIYDSLYQLSDARGWEAGAANKGPDSAGRVDSSALANYRQTYHYDASGNLLELTHVGAQRHGRQLKTALYSNRSLPWHNGVPPTEEQIEAAFDARGNLLELGRSVRWDLRNQLQSVSSVERASGLNDQEIYMYDADGQRMRKIRALRTNGRTTLTEVRYLPGLELRTDSAGKTLQVISVQTGLNSVQVVHWDGSPPGDNDSYRYNLCDHLGSTSLELGEDARIISQENYYPFGETAWSRESEVSYRTVRYSGKERDATGLYYFGYRYYMPWLQRWLNPDPAGAVDGHNRYRAMRNCPLVYRDRDGRQPSKKPVDRVYHDLAEQNLVHPLQAAGMQPVRRYFENDPNPDVQAYRHEIPKALAQLGAQSSSPLNTHQAHVIAAARTNTASPSGAVLYHSGELISSAMSRVVGEEATSRVMGPMSVAFNSPVEDPNVLAARRGAVSNGMKLGGQLLMHVSNPALKLVGAASLTLGNVMEISEAQTRAQYKLLSAPANLPPLASPNKPKASLHSLGQAFSVQQRPLISEQAPEPSLFAQQLLDAAFPPGLLAMQPTDDLQREDRLLMRPRRGSHHG